MGEMNTILFTILSILICGYGADFVEENVLFPQESTFGDDSFGWSVASSSDGTRVLVGSVYDDTMGINAGATYVFDKNSSDPNDRWSATTILYPQGGNDSAAGFSVAISSDGTRALFSATGDITMGPQAGAVYVFDVNPNDQRNWTRRDILYPSVGTGEPRFGESVAISSDGTRVLIGAPLDDQINTGAGAAYVFDVNPSSDQSDWTPRVVLFPTSTNESSFFGISVALSSDGTRALLGADGDDTMGPFGGAAYVFDVDPSNASAWMLQTILYPSNGTGSPKFGRSVALSSDGTRALIGVPYDPTLGFDVGSSYVFDHVDTASDDWMIQAILYPTNFTGEPSFGYSVALSSDGTQALVGAPLGGTSATVRGAAYVFGASDAWIGSAVYYPSAAESYLGWSAALSANGTLAILGAIIDSNSVGGGSAYVLERCAQGAIFNTNRTACETCPTDRVPNANRTACIPSDDAGENENPLARIIGVSLAGGAALLAMCCCGGLLIATCLLVLAAICTAIGVPVIGSIAGRRNNAKDEKKYAMDDDAEALRTINDKITNDWFIDYGDLEFIQELGTGAFGSVHLADWRCTEVAVKQLNLAADQVKAFVAEANVMKNLRPHANVVQLYGVCTDPTHPLAMVMEYLPTGDLLRYLRIYGPPEEALLTRMVLDISAGMQHLSAEGIVHRDLAARNLLLTDTLRVKVGDFGMSGNEVDVCNPDEGLVAAVRWLAPEILAQEAGFSQSTDVYAFAITMAELCSGGNRPYQGMNVNQMAPKVYHDGLRPELPEDTTPAWLAEITRKCWSHDPTSRPSFKAISKVVKKNMIRESKRAVLAPQEDYAKACATYDKPTLERSEYICSANMTTRQVMMMQEGAVEHGSSTLASSTHTYPAADGIGSPATYVNIPTADAEE